MLLCELGLSISIIGRGNEVPWGAGLCAKLYAEGDVILTLSDPDDAVMMFNALRYGANMVGENIEGESELLNLSKWV